MYETLLFLMNIIRIPENETRLLIRIFKYTSNLCNRDVRTASFTMID